MRGLFTRILPFSRCELCGYTGRLASSLCEDCLHALPQIGHACLRCGCSLPHPESACGKCLTRPSLANQTITAFRYDYPVDALIQRFKYRDLLRLAGPLAGMLASNVLANGRPLPEVMIPVPLHRHRLYRRGYNQATVICQALSLTVPIPLDAGLISRTRSTLPMFTLSAEERKRNITAAFVLNRPCTYQSIAIVDDVITSGSTLNEMARLLRCAGVNHIAFWALARAE